MPVLFKQTAIGQYQRWRNIKQWINNKVTLQHPRVWHRQCGLIDNLVAVKQQIQIQRARRPRCPRRR